MNLIFVKLIEDHSKTFELFSRFSPLVTNLLAGYRRLSMKSSHAWYNFISVHCISDCISFDVAEIWPILCCPWNYHPYFLLLFVRVLLQTSFQCTKKPFRSVKIRCLSMSRSPESKLYSKIRLALLHLRHDRSLFLELNLKINDWTPHQALVTKVPRDWMGPRPND